MCQCSELVYTLDCDDGETSWRQSGLVWFVVLFYTFLLVPVKTIVFTADCNLQFSSILQGGDLRESRVAVFSPVWTVSETQHSPFLVFSPVSSVTDFWCRSLVAYLIAVSWTRDYESSLMMDKWSCWIAGHGLWEARTQTLVPFPSAAQSQLCGNCVWVVLHARYQTINLHLLYMDKFPLHCAWILYPIFSLPGPQNYFTDHQKVCSVADHCDKTLGWEFSACLFRNILHIIVAHSQVLHIQ